MIARSGDPLVQALIGLGVTARKAEAILEVRKDREHVAEQLRWHQHRLANGFKFWPGQEARLLTWLLKNPERDQCPPGFYQAQHRPSPSPVPAPTAAPEPPTPTEPTTTDAELEQLAIAEGQALPYERRVAELQDMLLAGQHFDAPMARINRRMVERLAREWGVPLDALGHDIEAQAC